MIFITHETKIIINGKYTRKERAPNIRGCPENITLRSNEING